ncbi:MAG: two-component regulator propeller domain-containing protein [Rikenellaceae bacterium]
MIKFSTIYNTLYIAFAIIITSIVPSLATPSTSPELIQQLTVEDGLAINGVNTLCRDRKGYLWIGTYDGLNRYNGHKITTYNRQSHPQEFDNNRVRAIKEAPDGRIWIGTDNGLLIFDYSTSKFTPLVIDKIEDEGNGYTVKNIFVSSDKSEMVCVTEMDGIIRFGVDLKFYGQQNLITTDNVCYDAIALDQDIYILATQMGVEYYNLSSGNSKQILSKEIPTATTLLKIASDKLAIALQFGLQMVDMSRVDGEYSFKCSGSLLYSNETYKTMAYDEQHHLWLGSKNEGVKVVNIGQLGNSNSESLLENERISTMLFESNGVRWVATFDSGIYQYDNTQNQFKGISDNIKSSTEKIIQVVPYDNSRMLVRYVSNKLTIYNLRTEKFEQLPFQLTETEFSYVRRITYDNHGRIWLMISYKDHNVIAMINSKNGEVKRIEDHVLPSNIMSRGTIFTSDQNSDLWLATIDNIYKITLSKELNIETIESLKDNPYFKSANIHQTRVIYADNDHNTIWVGTVTDGLYRLAFTDNKELKSATITHYTYDKNNPQSLPSNSITSITRSPDGVLWIGTEQGGICRVKKVDNEIAFTSYTNEDGLSNNVVKGILYDHNGELWIPTNIGLNHFSPRTERFTIYRTEDGLPFMNFNYTSIKLQGGRMVFSGGSNILHFNPIDLKSNEGKPDLWFSSLRIKDNRIETGEEIDGRVLLDKSLADGDIIRLKHNENVISIGVDVMSNTKSDNYKVRYRLEPLSKRWTISPASSNQILFDGLKPDTYTLSVSCCNFYGAWSESKHLTFEIAPPIWQTTWAYITYSVIFLILLSLGIYTLLHILSLKHKLHIEHITRRNLETLNREKQRYFSNISHELKTPLTLILAPIAILTDKFKLDVNVTKSLQVINRQSKKMLQLIELAHNVQLESDNLLSTKLSIFDFNKFIDELTQDFKYYAESDDKTLNIIKMDEDVIVEADRSLIEKIVNNLLSNAFKHTRQKDKIRLRYSVDETMLTLIVEDSGYGIDEKDLPHIFERFYQAKKRGAANIGGTGIGLTFSHTITKLHGGDITVDSKFGEGTRFTVTLPIVADTREFTAIEEHSEETTPQDMEATMILGDMNIEDIKVREDLRSSLVYLVEDNSDMRDFLASIISQFYTVKTFS